MPRPAVQAAGILQWSGTSGAIRVSADGTGPVRLRITYTRREGEDGAARQVRRETRTLSGDTSYTSAITNDPGTVACDKRAYFGILVMTEPAAGNGPQVREVGVDGPACPTTPQPSHSATPTPTQEQTTSAFGTPTPSHSTSAPLARSSGQPSDLPLASPSTHPLATPSVEPGGLDEPDEAEGADGADAMRSPFHERGTPR
ncbi:hypothetical protein ITP53_52875 [Nonomuraea sp. K274]|uniref:Uncharacterized protein n=1 Tax=Nonomuraea cypriaca TaxID=1187855 RepID=A0A931ASL3_9ACTN|nr:hypothetical protein [Nonomuraea cypriaca]